MKHVRSKGLRVNVTPAMSAAIEREARRNDVSIATIVRAALRDYLKARK
jgi:predicted HicB family RNase H-like nuclease